MERTKGRGQKRQLSPEQSPLHKRTGKRQLRTRNQSSIKFYNREDQYYEFTNFYLCKVHIDGCVWPSTEHYFQAQKFLGTPYLKEIQMLSTPREALQMSRRPEVSIWRRSDWESVKNDIMYKALLSKFIQHKKLRKKLIQTGERELIEDSPHDSYWGIGIDGNGQNRLGKLLMRVRKCYLAQSEASTSASSSGILDEDDHQCDHRSRESPKDINQELPSKPEANTAAGQTETAISTTVKDTSSSVTDTLNSLDNSGGSIADENANSLGCGLGRRSLRSIRQETKRPTVMK